MLSKKLHEKISPQYIIEDIIGSGSYGTVFSGKQRQSGRAVAIKVFLTGQKLSDNCLNEIKLLFRLKHDHIVTALDFFFASGCYAIVFEFMNEGDLRQLMQHGPLEESHVLMIASQIASGLDYIHNKGIIHRDLKPENILIHRNSQEIRYKICDFNISRFAANGNLRATNQGSPLYMAPEQFYDNYDYRADLYALGVILYELLCGSPPFEGVYLTLMRAHIQNTPDWHPLEHISEHTQTMIQSLLAKDANQRPPNAKALLENIHTILQKDLPQRPQTPEASVQSKAPTGPILTWDAEESSFYLKYVDSSLWKQCYTVMSLPEPNKIGQLVEKDYLSL
ncbi:MAG: serine/threonine-protein kinase [Candidatus Sericytochromatia bacterium]|nr:serine/threonine-protein kinase [Candidatus Sericytochromatia bacterium]